MIELAHPPPEEMRRGRHDPRSTPERRPRGECGEARASGRERLRHAASPATPLRAAATRLRAGGGFSDLDLSHNRPRKEACAYECRKFRFYRASAPAAGL